MTAPLPTRVDVREVPPRQRHPLIFTTFSLLPPGEAMELVNDHDPKPLYYQFAAELEGQFGWYYLEQGPDVWRVAITRLAPSSAANDNSCCGSCGG